MSEAKDVLEVREYGQSFIATVRRKRYTASATHSADYAAAYCVSKFYGDRYRAERAQDLDRPVRGAPTAEFYPIKRAYRIVAKGGGAS